MKKAGFVLAVLLLQVGVTLSLGSVAAYGSTHDRAPSGLIIWGRDLSGLNRAEVESELKTGIPNSVIYKGQVYPLKLERSYTKLNNWLNEEFPSTTGTWIIDVLQSLSRKPALNLVPELDQEEITSQLEEISTKINKPMIPASISYANHQFEAKAGEEGQVLDVNDTWNKINTNHFQKQIEAVVKVLPIKPSLEDVSKIRNILGDYTTYFNPEDLPRTKNVRLAANALNNHLVAPGEVFSFNTVVGERTEAAGYLPAYIFINQEVVKGDGGGICQDSSTLFQAVRQANLSVVEKHTHSLPVSYVLKGQDATVAYGSLDFRFRNNTNGYLLISTLTGDNWVRIRLFGITDPNHPTLKKPDGYPICPSDVDKDFK